MLRISKGIMLNRGGRWCWPSARSAEVRVGRLPDRKQPVDGGAEQVFRGPMRSGQA